MNKETCKQCVADLGLDWDDRADVSETWKNTEKNWQDGIIVCPPVHTYPDWSTYVGVGIVEAGPPEWCSKGFENRMREKMHGSE